MKIAFLVLNHRQPPQLVRLLTTLRAQLPDAPIVVHHDIFHGEFPADLVEPIGDVHLLTSGKRVAWGDFSLVDVYCWSLAWMTENLDFDWVVLLSAQDYPIKPLAGLAYELTRDGADAVMRGTPISQRSTAAERRDMRRRYYFQYRPVAGRGVESTGKGSWLPPGVCAAFRARAGLLIDVLNIAQPLFKIYRFPDGMPYQFGWRARKVPFGSDNQCWFGSMWFGLSRGAVQYVIDYMTAHPDVVDYYRRTVIPDESMIATIILNAPHLRVENRELHYTRWSSTKTGHPDTFSLDDLAELATVPQYFARKFDLAADPRVLDELDELISAPVTR
jgi:hypothetical protein